MVADVARWSEAAGCEGILVYTDNGIVDPWLVSQLVIQATERLCPLVAVQSVYMHSYSVAKMVTSLAHLHGRRMYLNMVAGGFRNDLIALGDNTPHDERYERTVEYARIVMKLVSSSEPVDLEGRYYTVRNLRVTPPVPRECVPGITITGSSQARLAAGRVLGAIAVKYPQSSSAEKQTDRAADRVRHAHWRYRPRGSGRGLAGRVRALPPRSHGPDSPPPCDADLRLAVAPQLSALAHEAASEDNPYCLGHFENYETFCPYLVGDYGRVACELGRYIRLGFNTFILDIPASKEELHHIGVVFRQATAAVRP